METLDQIAIRHGTDKASAHPVKGHDYCRHYERWFGPLRERPVKLLEVGVGGGESIRAWLDYFADPGARVFGVDNVQGTNEWNSVGQSPESRYKFVFGDQSDPTFWKCFQVDYGKAWDVVIDDGGHFNDQVIRTFEGMWPAVAAGGLYCVEDLGVAYGAGTVFVRVGFPNHVDWLRSILDKLNTGAAAPLDFMYYAPELCLLGKK